MPDVSRQNEDRYCVFGVHEHGGWCFQYIAENARLARIEARRLLSLGWHDVMIFNNATQVNVFAPVEGVAA